MEVHSLVVGQTEMVRSGEEAPDASHLHGFGKFFSADIVVHLEH